MVSRRTAEFFCYLMLNSKVYFKAVFPIRNWGVYNPVHIDDRVKYGGKWNAKYARDRAKMGKWNPNHRKESSRCWRIESNQFVQNSRLKVRDQNLLYAIQYTVKGWRMKFGLC